MQLKSDTSQGWSVVLFLSGFSAAWNAVVWRSMMPFFWQISLAPDDVFHWWQSGGFLLAVLFALIGAGLALLAMYYFLKQLFTPRVCVKMASAALWPSGALQVQWTVTMRQRLLDLRFGLECREEIQEQPQGNDEALHVRRAQRKVLPLWKIIDVDAEGERHATLPADLLDVVARDGGDLRWYLTVRGRVAWLPDVADDLPVTVQHAAPAT